MTIESVPQPAVDIPDVADIDETPLTIDDIRKMVFQRRSEATRNLERLRAQRDLVNEAIKRAVAEEAEASRIARSFEPRAKKAKK